MLVSTKGRYALRVLLDLAQNSAPGQYRRLDAIAQEQGISEKYLESIVNVLMKAELLKGVRGRGGGYALTRLPEEYTVGEVLRITDGSLAPVACLECEGESCPRAQRCQTLPMWKQLDRIIQTYLESVKLTDLMTGSVEKKFSEFSHQE